MGGKAVLQTDIILTADHSIMNNFHLKGRIALPFYGSGEMFPRWLFAILVGKPEHKDGIVTYAPYPLRKVEATLLDAGFNVRTIAPSHLKHYLPDAKILGIHTVDPLGLASKPFLYEAIKGTHQYSTTYFQQLIQQPCIKEAKKQGLKIILGGEGAWQLQKNPESPLASEIDTIVIGEAENTLPRLCHDIFEGKPVQKYVSSNNNSHGLDDISNISTIRNASISGCIEIGRGCNRHCKFCEVTKKNLRWYPLEKIEKELQVNRCNGLIKGIIHAEDVFLYGTTGFIPDDAKLTNLFELVYRYYDEFLLTHFSFAAIQANTSLFKNLMEIVSSHQKFIIGETGIETGSIRLMKQTMSGKALPFKMSQWTSLITESLSLLHDHHFIPYCSLIIGLPGETDNDVVETLNLIDDLKDLRFILLPSGFTPLGTYTDLDEKKYDIDSLTPLRKELIKKCVVHNTYWTKKIGKIILQEDFGFRMLSKLWYTQSHFKGLISYYKADIGRSSS
ncbi:tRNA-2-methylthio-N(6)-dimethylallyladenosine synthase [uncultured archaeon]|nr:tRNA-2-methylthio-N(6)-dimethylallyladenosine synthase [uncultured archaeon]